MGKITDIIYEERINELRQEMDFLQQKTILMQQEIEEMKKLILTTNEYVQKVQEHQIALQESFIKLCREIKDEQSW